MQLDLFQNPSPKSEPTRCLLRPYQREAVAAIRQGFRDYESLLMECPTGTGKTEILVELARGWTNGRTLVICPFTELVGQAARKIRQRIGVAPAIEQAELWSDESPWSRCDYVVASKDTLTRGRTAGGKRYERFADVGLVVVDEAHLSITEAWVEMLTWFRIRGAKVLGVTATPKRHDSKAMGQVYEHVAYQYGIADAVQDGWLVPARAQVVQIESLDLSGVGSTSTNYGQDFNREQLNAAMEDETTVHEIADVVAKETTGRRTAIYCSSVREAQLVAERLADSYSLPADWICGDRKKCPADRRAKILRDFAAGVLTHVANVGVLTTGWDCPALEVIVQARPTRSTALYTQILGRGTRPLPGVVDFEGSTPDSRRSAIGASAKPHFTILDLVDNTLNHKIVTCADVLGGKWTLEARARAKAEMAKGGAADIDEACAKAQEQIEREQEERRRRAAVRAEARYRTQQVDPFDGPALGVHRAKPTGPVMPFGKHKGKPLTAVPSGYLRWALGDGAVRTAWLRSAVAAELARREGRPAPTPQPTRMEQLDLDEVFGALR